jgi:cell division septation protein DedD
MDDERTGPPPRPAATAGVAARAILASSKQQGLRHAAGAAKLGLALTRRPGHVIVTGPDGQVTEALVRAAESQVGALRIVRGTADEGRVDDLLRSLRDAGRGERVAGVVGDADRLSAASLARLHAGLDAGALERGDVRLVLVGSPALLQTLRDERLGPLMAHVCLQLDVPAADESAAAPAPERRAPVAGRRGQGVFGIGRLEIAGITAVIVVGSALWAALRFGPPPSVPEPSATRIPQAEATVPTVAPPAEVPAVTPVDRPAPHVAPEPPATEPAPPRVVVPAATEPAAPPATEPAAPQAAAPQVVATPAPHAVAPRAPRASTGFALQVGAFSRAENATRLAARLGRRFGRVEVTKTVRGATTLHRVRIVGFASDAARRVAARRLAAEGLEPILVH